VFDNATIVASLGQEPTTKKIAALVDEYRAQPDALAEALFVLLKQAEKAGFALDILMYEPPEDIVPPAYVSDGLSWLDQELRNGGGPDLSSTAAPTEDDAQ
jgi:hypothetical protein